MSAGIILVWGATEHDAKPLFTSNHPSGIKIKGPRSGAFRREVRDFLGQTFTHDDLIACFSEQADTYGHHRGNPGFYEPWQLNNARLVVLVLPAQRSLGVNTWEIALACETDDLSRPVHLNRAIFVLPESVWQYLVLFFQSRHEDPAKFTPLSEPELGPANSFFARWVALTWMREFRRIGQAKPKHPPFPAVVYCDSKPWDLRTKAGRKERDAFFQNLRNMAETRLSL